MIEVQIVRQFHVRRLDGSRLEAGELHGEGERLMGALLELEACNADVRDPSTASDADSGVVTVELLIRAESEVAALEKSKTVARTAIHAIGGATPWESTPARTIDYVPRNVLLEYV
ncbi:hypothetical protein [Asanoa iriomotensis]|uniref:Uncharacterized protein n=1 Tax=Asanoa iriomotensis TaxID=234613 RepID=A0ABQ4CHE5_9ACTN|nr:hypothetical protein [Asanoa iriomotensis]GIF61886.1 hypothetical protein Air01nite_79810 [Asanoa iriomotensis]